MKKHVLLVLGLAMMLAFPVCAQETEEVNPDTALTETESEMAEEKSMTMDKKTVKKLMADLGDSALRTTRKFLKKGGVAAGLGVSFGFYFLNILSWIRNTFILRPSNITDCHRIENMLSQIVFVHH